MGIKFLVETDINKWKFACIILIVRLSFLKMRKEKTIKYAGYKPK